MFYEENILYLCCPKCKYQVLDTIERYIIDLKALHDDNIHFEYDINDDFFAMLDTSEFQKGKLRVSVDVKKLADSFDISFQINGQVVVICDRCLDEMNQEVSSTNRLRVKFGSEYTDVGDDVVIVPEDEGSINIVWFIYEFIALAIPIRHVHAEGDCNPEMMQKLKSHLSYNVAEDSNSCDDMIASEKPMDPRWNDLKNLLDNN